MSGKSIVMIIEYRHTMPQFLEQLTEVFGSAVEIRGHVLGDPGLPESHPGQVLLTSAGSAADFLDMKQKIGKRDLICGMLYPQKKMLSKLNVYPKGTRILLSNVSRSMAEESIYQLLAAGFGHLDFVPYYPGAEIPEDVHTAVTFGEPGNIPAQITDWIDLGYRQIDASAIIEAAHALDLDYILKTRRFIDYMNRQFSLSAGLSILTEQNIFLDQRHADLVQLCDAGMLEADEHGRIVDVNFRAAMLLEQERSHLIGQRLTDILPGHYVLQCRTNQVMVHFHLGKLNVELRPVLLASRCIGMNVSLRALDADNPENIYAKPATLKGRRAKYSFSDIVGDSDRIRRTMELARRMARTESSVLITGESGTGKELFAQSIHNSSGRADAPFVVINCAALPATLMESELFGYEEGAFTGAKKGGKIGLLELADNGTIFFDEVEGMSPETQLKLLRAIQEKEIVRVGGERVIPINVRIISATNENLLTLIREGRFREDLYYRLCTLPLDLPPLRDRREDIFPILESFKQDLRLTFQMTEEAEQMLLRYDWPGNIRELRNCVEFLGCAQVPVIDLCDLPGYVLENTDQNGGGSPDKGPADPAAAAYGHAAGQGKMPGYSQKTHSQTNRPSERAKYQTAWGGADAHRDKEIPADVMPDVWNQADEYDIQTGVLRLLRKKSCGRAQLAKRLALDGILVDEARLRRILERMKEAGWIDSGTGRRGSYLTSVGAEEWKRREGLTQ